MRNTLLFAVLAVLALIIASCGEEGHSMASALTPEGVDMPERPEEAEEADTPDDDAEEDTVFRGYRFVVGAKMVDDDVVWTLNNAKISKDNLMTNMFRQWAIVVDEETGLEGKVDGVSANPVIFRAKADVPQSALIAIAEQTDLSDLTRLNLELMISPTKIRGTHLSFSASATPDDAINVNMVWDAAKQQHMYTVVKEGWPPVMAGSLETTNDLFYTTETSEVAATNQKKKYYKQGNSIVKKIEGIVSRKKSAKNWHVIIDNYYPPMASNIGSDLRPWGFTFLAIDSINNINKKQSDDYNRRIEINKKRTQKKQKLLVVKKPTPLVITLKHTKAPQPAEPVTEFKDSKFLVEAAMNGDDVVWTLNGESISLKDLRASFPYWAEFTDEASGLKGVANEISFNPVTFRAEGAVSMVAFTEAVDLTYENKFSSLALELPCGNGEYYKTTMDYNYEPEADGARPMVRVAVCEAWEASNLQNHYVVAIDFRNRKPVPDTHAKTGDIFYGGELDSSNIDAQKARYNQIYRQVANFTQQYITDSGARVEAFEVVSAINDVQSEKPGKHIPWGFRFLTISVFNELNANRMKEGKLTLVLKYHLDSSRNFSFPLPPEPEMELEEEVEFEKDEPVSPDPTEGERIVEDATDDENEDPSDSPNEDLAPKPNAND